MIYLSDWVELTVTVAPPEVGTVLTVPRLLVAYPAVVCSAYNQEAPARVALDVTDPPTLSALATDYRFPPLTRGVPVGYDDYRAAMLTLLDRYAAAAAAAGVTVAGTDALDGATQRTFRIPLTDALNLNVTQIAVGLSLGILTLPQSIGPDSAGHALLIPDAATWAAFLAAYHPARIKVDGGPGTGGGGELLARIAAATTTADLDAVTFPDP